MPWPGEQLRRHVETEGGAGGEGQYDAGFDSDLSPGAEKEDRSGVGEVEGHCRIGTVQGHDLVVRFDIN